MANGGMDLAQVDSHVLYNIGYSEMVALSKTTQEENEAKERIEQIFVDQQFEQESGLPPVAQMYPPIERR